MIPTGLKYTLRAVPLLILAAAPAVAGKYFRSLETPKCCNDICIRYVEDDVTDLPEVDPDEINKRISISDGVALGKRLDEINLDAIEKALQTSSVISKAQAWVTQDGILHLDLVRRAPVMWLQDGSRGYYIDKFAYPFQLPDWDRGGLPVASGPFSSKPELALELIEWKNGLQGSDLWGTGIDDIRMDAGGDISFRLSGRKETILFGGSRNASDKAARIKLYYDRIEPSLRDGIQYSTVNVKYDKQIVCR